MRKSKSSDRVPVHFTLIASLASGGSGSADQERTAAEIGSRGLRWRHVLVHVGLRSVPALEAVRMSAAARMIAF